MDLFLCWSGEKSRLLALFLREWIPSVLQVVRPWMSESDADKGTRWNNEISQQLDRVAFAVVCLAGNNQASPWVNFESGAVSKLGGRVATVCLDLRKTDVLNPLGMFQGTDLGSKDDVERLMVSINTACLEDALDAERVKTYLERWWPDLDAKVRELRTLGEDRTPPRREPQALLEEILERVRAIDAPSAPETGLPAALELLTQPYPVGDACQIVSGMEFFQNSASHDRVRIAVSAHSLKEWQLAALQKLADDSGAEISIKGFGGATLFPIDEFVVSPDPDGASVPDE
jgi:hypothetical protein